MHGHFAGLSPPTQVKVQPPSPYFPDAASPGSEVSSHTHHDESQFDNSGYGDPFGKPRLGHTLQGAGDDDVDDDGYNWTQFLPPDVELSRGEHDTVLDTFFKFFSSWCYRTIPDLFLRDMRRYLEQTKTLTIDLPQSPLDEKPLNVLPKTVHYTPMLHNAILALALAYSDVPQLSKRSTRVRFINQAKSTLEIECARPSLACVQALSYIASFYSGEGEQTLGFLYFGMSVRMSQARESTFRESYCEF